MPRYFATCARGLERILARELEQISAQEIVLGRGGVHFFGGLETLYRANLELRTAVRVLQPLSEFLARNPDELYDACRQIRWDELLTVNHTLAVDCNVRDSGITHSQYAARRVKDAICDQFRDRTGARPSVDVERPMLGLNLHIHRDHAILSLDSSWDSLHKRGYRPIQTRAPINEALAAGLIQHLGYTGETPLIDWMCGSATFLIESAWIAQRRPPNLTRKWFCFLGWMNFDPGLWAALRDEARLQVQAKIPHPPRGIDIRADALDLAQRNARAAGVGHLIRLEKSHFADLREDPSQPPGVILCNPPYGERLGDEESLVPLYRQMGEVFREHWPFWKLAVFTGNDRLAREINLPVQRRTDFFNGSIPCKLWEFRHPDG
jgi:putative N6-adenine-specific DNA methylase